MIYMDKPPVQQLTKEEKLAGYRQTNNTPKKENSIHEKGS